MCLMEVSWTGQQAIHVVFFLFARTVSVVFLIRLKTPAALRCCAFKKTLICARVWTLKLYHSQLANACISSAVSSTGEKHNSPGPVTQSSQCGTRNKQHTQTHSCGASAGFLYEHYRQGIFFFPVALSKLPKQGGRFAYFKQRTFEGWPLLHMWSTSQAWIIQAGKDKSWRFCRVAVDSWGCRSCWGDYRQLRAIKHDSNFHVCFKKWVYLYWPLDLQFKKSSQYC